MWIRACFSAQSFGGALQSRLVRTQRPTEPDCVKRALANDGPQYLRGILVEEEAAPLMERPFERNDSILTLVPMLSLPSFGRPSRSQVWPSEAAVGRAGSPRFGHWRC